MQRHFPLHDGLFKGIRLADGKSCELVFTTSDGENYLIVLRDLIALHLGDFREGNIVSECFVLSGEPVPEFTPLTRLWPPPHPAAADHYHAAAAAFVAARRAEIENGTMTVFEITSSYGAQLVAVCRSVESRQG